MNNKQEKKICQVKSEKFLLNYDNFDKKSIFELENAINEQYKKSKSETQRVGALFRGFDEKKAETLLNCGDFLEVSILENKKRLTGANFCKSRLCPICEFNLSRKHFRELVAIVNHEKMQNQKFVFVTLTLKNCNAFEFENTINAMNKAFLTLSSNKTSLFKNAFNGWCKKLEVTCNEKLETFHVHFHILASVDADYFQKSNKKYLTQKKLCEHWQKALKVDYLPICDIRAVTSKNITKSERKTKIEKYSSLAEISKYTTKTMQVKNPKVLQILNKVLKGKRLFDYAGNFKAIRKELKISESESDFDVLAMRENPETLKAYFHWCNFANSYELKQIIKAEKEILLEGQNENAFAS